MNLEISFKFIDEQAAKGDHKARDLLTPKKGTKEASGYDLVSANLEPKTLAPLERTLIPTGIAIALPEFYEAQVRPRSGLAFKSGLTVLNSPGTIDSDYRGEIKVILINLGKTSFTIERGMRIAQLVFAPVLRTQLSPSITLDQTERGAGGFGSTGITC